MDQKQIEEIVRSVMASMGQTQPQTAAPIIFPILNGRES